MMSFTETRTAATLNWRDYGFYEYLLVINPVSTVMEKILTEKQEFFNHYGEEGAIKTLPHIALLSFLANENMEDILIRWIQRICNQHMRFDITFNNYSGFPPHTVYVRIQDPHPLRCLAKQLKVIDSFVSSSGCPPLKVSGKPHVIIAKTVSASVFDKALMEYSAKTFHESFMAEELVFLKRSHHSETYKKVNVFYLSPHENVKH